MLIPLRSEQDNGEDATDQLNPCQWLSGQLGPCQHLQLGKQSVSAILSAWAMVATRGAEKARCQQTGGQGWVLIEPAQGSGGRGVQQWELTLLTGACTAQYANTSHPSRGKEPCC